MWSLSGIGKAESAGVTRGMVSNIDKTVQGILQSVDIAGTQSNVEIRVVNVGIAGQHIKSLQHRGLITRAGCSRPTPARSSPGKLSQWMAA